MIKRSLCVYCGSSPGKNEIYRQQAIKMGKLMVDNDIDLIYGGASIGVMGAIADSVLEHGGYVFGVMPRDLVAREVAHHGITKLYITNSMHERKALMANLCDGFVALPGGFGTYEELFEAITWSQLKMHQKPIYVVNINEYFTPFIEMVEHGVKEGFIQKNYLTLFKVVEDIESLIEDFS